MKNIEVNFNVLNYNCKKGVFKNLGKIYKHQKYSSNNCF